MRQRQCWPGVPGRVRRPMSPCPMTRSLPPWKGRPGVVYMEPLPLTLVKLAAATEPGWYILPMAAITEWWCALVGDAHHGTVAEFVAAVPATTLSGGTCVVQPRTYGGNANDTLDHHCKLITSLQAAYRNIRPTISREAKPSKQTVRAHFVTSHEAHVRGKLAL